MLAINKQIFQAILSGVYTPLDLREFVQLCHDLALPMIRKKIAQGKLRLDTVGLKELDVVYDCLADLFQRDAEGGFPQIRTYFQKNVSDVDNCTEIEFVSTLRGLIFGKINNYLIRLYSEIDPALGKILRNIKIAMEKSKQFEELTRFGEMCLMPKGIDAQLHLAPMPCDHLEREFSHTVLVHDSIPEMLYKLHALLVEEGTYQRAVSLVSAGLLCKNVYKLGWETEQEADVIEEKIDMGFFARIVDNVCQAIQHEMYRTYVEKGKCTDAMFTNYIQATKSILNASYVDEHLDGSTYFDYLQVQMPELTRENYRNDHRTILEYLTKIGKQRLRTQLKTL